jgi:crotonobetainyl-CoA:carnitine CoA-transferase CaiB-like acyl-CoA transferase
MVQEIPHPTLGTVKQLGLPIKFSRTPGALDQPPPLLGEHNQKILQELGFSSAEIDDLKAAEII